MRIPCEAPFTIGVHSGPTRHKQLRRCWKSGEYTSILSSSNLNFLAESHVILKASPLSAKLLSAPQANKKMSTFSFSGHETFPLRFTWLTKAVEVLRQNSQAFGAEDAIAEFGVGRNMVRAIRHWGLAAGVLEPVKHERGAYVPSRLGDLIFGTHGADPYCEDLGTAWLLHWQLCRSADIATLWHFLFGHWHGGAVEIRTLELALEAWLERKGGTLPAATTLRRDLQCLVGSYVPSRSARADLEDVAACPLSSLGLLYTADGTAYLREGRQIGLPPEVFAYAIIDFWQGRAPEMETLAVQDVLLGVDSPGRIFLLSADHAYDLVGQVEEWEEPPFRFDSTAGVQQLYRAARRRPLDMLTRYYGAVVVAS